MSSPKALYSAAFLGLVAMSVSAQSQLYQQCGGIGFTGAKACVSGATCTTLNDYYSQCLPGAAAPAPTTAPAPAPAPPPTKAPTPAPAPPPTKAPTPPTANPTPTGVPAPAPTKPASTGTLRYAGINIAGFDFGCDTTGACTASGAWPPLLSYYGHDGGGQMDHFVNDGGFNVFRLPVGWQFLTGDAASGTLNETNFAKYDDLIQTCLGTGADCIIDIHNYARFNGKIIGQGGPTNEVFAALWGNIAAKYVDNPKILFGIMNEPHDVPDIEAWGVSVQAAVTAIRNAGATSQLILLPGNDWTSAEKFISNGSGAALSKVKNPDGSFTGLIFDVHKYLDSDNSGTHDDCVTDNVDNAFGPLATWLRANGRQAINTETGGGNTDSCAQFLCQQIEFQKANSDVFLGYVGWSAGNFDPSYVLSEVPTNNGGVWTDTALVSSCLAPNKSS